MGTTITIIIQYPVMFFVYIYVLYIRTFLSQSPRSLTHSLVTETLYFPSNLWSLSMDYIHRIHTYSEACVPRSICTQHICTHTYFPRRIFLHLWREFRFSQTISHCTDIQPSTTKIFSNTYIMWIKISLQGVGLVRFDFVYKCGFVEYWKIREISTSASENVDFIGSTVGFDRNKIFTIGPISNIDAV